MAGAAVGHEETAPEPHRCPALSPAAPSHLRPAAGGRARGRPLPARVGCCPGWQHCGRQLCDQRLSCFCRGTVLEGHQQRPTQHQASLSSPQTQQCSAQPAATPGPVPAPAGSTSPASLQRYSCARTARPCSASAALPSTCNSTSSLTGVAEAAGAARGHSEWPGRALCSPRAATQLRHDSMHASEGATARMPGPAASPPAVHAPGRGQGAVGGPGQGHAHLEV